MSAFKARSDWAVIFQIELPDCGEEPSVNSECIPYGVTVQHGKQSEDESKRSFVLACIRSEISAG